MYFFEFVTLEPIAGFHKYYYFAAAGTRCPRSIKLDNNYPDKIRLLVDDREETPFRLNCLSFPVYIFRKYIKKPGSFSFGYRIDWEKEEF